jgi:hypothetical protein
MTTEYSKMQMSLYGRTKCRQQVNNFIANMKACVSLCYVLGIDVKHNNQLCISVYVLGIAVKHNNQLCFSCAHIETAFNFP